MSRWHEALITGAVAMVGACGADTVEMTGVVLAERLTLDPAVGLGVSVLDDDGNTLDATETDDQGAFSLRVPPQLMIHLQVEGQGHRPIAFTGESGRDEVFDVRTGELWAFPDAEAERWIDDFEGCPGAEPGATMVIGEVRLQLAGGDPLDPGETPVERNGLAWITDRDGEGRIDACYLDDEGTYDPGAGRVGATGRFAVFGLEAGRWELHVARPTSGDGLVKSLIPFRLPEGGVVSRHPALVAL